MIPIAFIALPWTLPLLVFAMGLNAYGLWANCPHCGKRFARRGLRQSTFTQKCLNCGVRMGTAKSGG